MTIMRLLLVGLLLAVGLVPVRGEKLSSAVVGKHSAWRVEGTNGPLYLLGSVHVLKPEHYPLPTVFESAFSNAAVVVFESDIGAMQKTEVQMKLLGQAALPEGKSLKDQLSDETYAALQAHLERSGVPAMMINKLRPGFAMMTLVMVELQRLGYRSDQGLDVYFYNRAQQQNKTVRGLETVDFQIGLLTGMDQAEGESVVKSTLAELKDARAKFEQLLAAWQTGDEAALEKLLNEANRQEPALMKRLVTDRNWRWIPRVEELARGTNRAVVIVGAAHLVGEGGVVDLLRKRGWTVTQE